MSRRLFISHSTGGLFFATPTQGVAIDRCGSVESNMQFFACSIFLFFALRSFFATADQNEKSLNGENWQLSDSTGEFKGVQATVPGVAHLDLL